jgi:predicted RND superfamily exporter protein
MSIKELIKNKLVIMAVFVFLVVLLAFGLGYLTALNFNHAPIIIEKSTL